MKPFIDYCFLNDYISGEGIKVTFMLTILSQHSIYYYLRLITDVTRFGEYIDVEVHGEHPTRENTGRRLVCSGAKKTRSDCHRVGTKTSHLA